MSDEFVVFTLMAVLGLAVGSFLNVVAYRVPINRSVLRPRSACPACAVEISPRDNIPVVSWLVLRGKCRACQDKISPRYLFVEAATAAAFTITTAVVGLEWVLPAFLWFVSVTIVLILTDIDHKLIPNRILYPGIVVGMVLLVAGGFADGGATDVGRAMLGGAAYFIALLVVALAAPAGGFGFGDVKLAILLGLFTGYLGWGQVAVAFFFAFLAGGALSMLLLVTGIKGRKDAIPFGPYLVFGAYLAIVWGDQILDWYLA